MSDQAFTYLVRFVCGALFGGLVGSATGDLFPKDGLIVVAITAFSALVFGLVVARTSDEALVDASERSRVFEMAVVGVAMAAIIGYLLLCKTSP